MREPVEVVSIIRRMRGGSQSFLVRGSDGGFYVAKFTGNPQGNRTLINECIAGDLLSALGVATPELAIVKLGDSCEGREQLYFSTDRREPIVNGLHLGSKYPVDPNVAAIFDFLPRNLYSRVANLNHAGIVFAFDCWVAHADTRQFVYVRSRKDEHMAASKHDGKASFTAWAIDNGKCFGGDWNLTELILPTFDPTFEMYRYCHLEESASAGAKMIQELPADLVHSCHEQIPRDWFTDGDEEGLAMMLKALQRRQREAVAVVRKHVSAVRNRMELAG